MKIIFLNDDFLPATAGGAASVVFNLSQELIRQNHSVVVITTTFNSSKTLLENYQNIKVYRLPTKRHGLLWRSYFSLYNPFLLKKIKKIFQTEKPDVIHAHSIYTYAISYAVLKLARKFTNKVFFTAHDVMPFSYGKLIFSADKIPKDFLTEKNYNYKISWATNLKRVGKAFNPFKKIFIRHYLKYAKQIFIVSHALKNALQQNKILKNNNNSIILYNALDLNFWQTPPADEIKNFKNKYSLGNSPIIFFGGRLSMAKGFQQTLQTIAKIKQQIPNIKLLIVGENKDFKSKAVSDINKLNLSSNIIFTNWLTKEQIKLAYASSNLIFVPSICFDSFPTINLEAMALKKPVLATCLGGSKEIIQHSINGYIIQPYQIEKNVQVILNLLNNPDLFEKIGRQALISAQNNCNMHNKTKKIIKFYEAK